jgi:hypothetical protein
MSGDYQLEDTVYLPFTTRAFATGVPTALVSGEVQIYEDASVTQITGAETLTVSLDSVAGFNMVQVDMTAANGFESGKSYTGILSAGTVGGVSVIGEVVFHFTIEMSAAALDLANGTDGLGAIKTDTAAILDDTGTSGVLISDGTGAGQIALTSGAIDTVTTTTTATNLTNAPTNGDLTATMKASVNAEVDTALITTTYSEPGQGAPGVDISIKDKISYLYKAWRNRSTQTATTYTLYADDTTTADQAATVSDDATTADKGEVGTGA